MIGVIRARVTRPFLEAVRRGRPRVTEHGLREIAGLVSWPGQRQAWERLFGEC